MAINHILQSIAIKRIKNGVGYYGPIWGGEGST